MKKLAVFLLLALTIPALGAPFALRPEVPVSDPVFGLARGIGRADARIATNGSDYLAVWTDLRHGNEPAVYATRMRADGSLLDPLGIRIAESAFAGPVVWTGSKYLIAYEAKPDSLTNDGQSYVRTMTVDGVFGEPIPAGRGARWGSMATNGTNVLLVLPNQAMLLDLEGNKLRDVTLAPLGAPYAPVRVAAAGSTYLVAVTVPAVVVQTVSSDGTAGAPRTLADPKEPGPIGLASDGERFLVIWPDQQLYAQLVTAGGTPTGPVHTIAPAPANYPSVAWRDGEYFVLYNHRGNYSHYALRLAADGSPVGEPKQLQQDYSADVEIAAHGRGGIALFRRMQAGVFDDASLAGDDVFRRIVDVAVTALPQRNVRLARLGDGYVVAWAEEGGIRLSRGPGTAPVVVQGSSFSLIDVLVDRSNVIWVLWIGWHSRIVGLSRFWGDLTPVDPGPIYFEVPGGIYVDAAAAGDGVIALAYQVGDPDLALDVAALLLWETGNGIARKDVLLTTEYFADYGPSVAFDGSAFVYGWSHAKGAFPSDQDAPSPEIELVGARVSPGGELLDATPVRIADDVGWILRAKAARGANGVAFAWQADGLTTRAALFDGTAIDLGGPYTSLAELTPHNDGFLLLRGIRRSPPALTEVEYVVLGADLSVSGTGTLPPYESGRFHEPFDIDVIGGSMPVFVYAKSTDERFGYVTRVFVRRTGEGPVRRRVLR